MSVKIKQEHGQMWVQDNDSWAKAEMINVKPDGSITVKIPESQTQNVTPDEHGYNGWTNYETWCVNLHLTNDESFYRLVLQCQNADELKSWVNDRVESVLYGSSSQLNPTRLMLSDLLTSSLQSVNWYEIYDGLHSEDEKDDSNG